MKWCVSNEYLKRRVFGRRVSSPAGVASTAFTLHTKEKAWQRNAAKLLRNSLDNVTITGRQLETASQIFFLSQGL